ncbi:MAG: AmmeMemoRadiSam system radical SAM enzyme [Elusimicrobiales bacterium]|nr:AmmeMemoRadiSam system radical SAM enzyme [Elusimicrobiales bacterium]MCK5106719.1 AmmeMemoRadiSam system radical SAM enzyme [Elusimicrobiales bacterium]MCK5358940.1 AmmeMemoRadiSam system radical SAM enzyme [Elusimicrobiales bacterium]
MNKRGRLLAVFVSIVFLFLSFFASWLISKYQPPETFSKIFSLDNDGPHQAKFGKKICNGIQCGLCPHKCFLPDGARGKCRVRINSGGSLLTLNYSKPVAVHIDPIEKKPVYHLLPGSLIYSISTAGCNLKCKWCQNWQISQIYPEEAPEKLLTPINLKLLVNPLTRQVSGRVNHKELSSLSPKEVVDYAIKSKCKSIAYTYGEPVIFYEYMYDTAKLAKEKGLKNVMVTAGYINPQPLRELVKYMDVVKVDLKGFNKKFYSDYVGGDLERVKETLLVLKEEKVFFEIVNLIVPTLNDNEKDMRAMVSWIKNNLGLNVPIFFSRFSPNYKLKNVPITPLKTLEKARNIALKEGLNFVYIGNLSGHPGESTYCPKCKKMLIKRHGYVILGDLISRNNGKCPYCGTEIPGVWK